MKNTTIPGIVGGAIIVIVIMVTVINPMLADLDSSLYDVNRNIDAKYSMVNRTNETIIIESENNYLTVNGEKFLARTGGAALLAVSGNACIVHSLNNFAYLYVGTPTEVFRTVSVTISNNVASFQDTDNNDHSIDLGDSFYIWSSDGEYGSFNVNPSKPEVFVDSDITSYLVWTRAGGYTNDVYPLTQSIAAWTITRDATEILIPFTPWSTDHPAEETYKSRLDIALEDYGQYYGVEITGPVQIDIDGTWTDVPESTRSTDGFSLIAPLEYTTIEPQNAPISSILRAISILLIVGLIIIIGGAIIERREIEA